MRPTPWWHGAILIGAAVLCLLVTTPKPGHEWANRIGMACAIVAGLVILIEAIRQRRGPTK